MNTILKNWSFFRFLRLALGIMILLQGIASKDVFMGIAGAIFSTMALFNAGCCGTNNCSSPKPKSNDSSKEITYEEVD